jgi:methyltransferase (TIGR00027 family)
MTIVAAEQVLPAGQRILNDPLAADMLPIVLRAIVQATRLPALRAWLLDLTEKRGPGVYAGTLCRKRYIDDQLATARGAVDALVILGAGFDTRAYRLPDLAAIPVFEVDLPENVARKRGRLEKRFGVVPAHVTLVPADLERDDLGAMLVARGYRPKARTFFIWEAVSQYLSESGVRNTLAFLAGAGAGSQLAFTYILQSFLDGTDVHGAHVLYEGMVIRNRIWRFGLAPGDIAGLLADYGWSMAEQMDSSEMSRRYLEPLDRRMPLFAAERSVYAGKP